MFIRLQLKRRLSGCFLHLRVTPIFGHGVMVLLLVVHLLLGYRELRDIRYYQDDPLMRRILGLTRLPDASTLSRALASTDARNAAQLRRLCRHLVLERLAGLGLRRITVDFGGSVLSTSRFAEGTAVGFNRKKKGRRSYYPLFCTLAQTGQILDVWHRPGNVHDSNDAQAFILECIREIRSVAPYAIIETRMDSAFFSDEIVRMLDAEGVEYRLSVPFERFAKLKHLIEARKHWCVTAVLAHNLSRELQMETMLKHRATTAKRTQLWAFVRLDTLRRKLIQRAGRLTRPQGKLTLTMSANKSVKNELLHYLTGLEKAA